MENDNDGINAPFVKSAYYPGKLIRPSYFIREQ